MNEKKKNILDNGSKATEGSDQSISRSVSSAARESSKSLEKSLTTLSWLVTVNVDELRKKHEKEDKGSFINITRVRLYKRPIFTFKINIYITPTPP